MIAQRIWALISENTVQNTIVCETYPAADELAKLTLGTDAFAVEITQIPTGIGDGYENGIFKDKQGNVINPLPTAEQEVTVLKAELATAKEINDTLIMDNLAMQSQIDDIAVSLLV